MAAAVRTRGAHDRVAGSRSGARGVPASSQVANIQRARLLAGAVRAVDRFGYTRTTVSEITAHAHVSRRTFYELFDNSEDCLAAMLDDAVERVRVLLAKSVDDGAGWRERVREGLGAILGFLDREPVLARVCIVESARGGQRILEAREQILTELAGAIDRGRVEGDPRTDCPPLTAEGLVGAALSIVHTRVLRRESTPLVELQGELMAMIVLPYLGPAAARRERKRPNTTPAIPVGGSDTHGDRSPSSIDAGASYEDPLRGIP